MNNRNKMQQYQAVGVQTSIMDADPHRLIQLLYQGALDNLSKAKGAIEREDIEQRNNHLNKTIQIVGGLREFLDFEKGGELSKNLDQLYDYVEYRLFEANIHHNAQIVTECIGLLKEVSGAWDEIRPAAINKTEGSVATP